MQKKDGSVSGESSRMERPIKLVIDGSPSHQRRAQTHRIGNVGHTRVSRDRGICSSSFAEFTSHRKSHYFRVSIRVEAAPPSPPSSLPSRIIQHHHLYSSLISRRIFVQIRSEICWDRNLRFRFYIFFFSTRSIFFFLSVNQDVTNDELRSRDEYRRGEKRQENRVTTDCASSCKPTGQMQCARCVISMLVPKKAFIVLIRRGRVINFRYRLPFSFYVYVVV